MIAVSTALRKLGEDAARCHQNTVERMSSAVSVVEQPTRSSSAGHEDQDDRPHERADVDVQHVGRELSSTPIVMSATGQPRGAP